MMHKMILLIASSFIFVCASYAQTETVEYGTINSKAPVELQLLVKHLKSNIKSGPDLMDVINYSNLINNDLSKAQTSTTLYLIKSEIYRNFLKSVYLPNKSKITVNLSLIDSVKNRVSKNNYSELSKWLIESILEDLKYFSDNGLLDNKNNIARFNSNDRLLAIQLDKKLEFLGPWLSNFEKLSLSDFEEIITKTSISTLKSIATKSYYFTNFSGTYGKEQKAKIFTIPDIAPLKEGSPAVSRPKNVREIAEDIKKRAQKEVKNINPEDLSPASTEIDRIDPDDAVWIPK